jgi:hypothetical protein
MEKFTDDELDNWELEDSENPDSSEAFEKSVNQLSVIRQNQDYNLEYLTQIIGKNVHLSPHYQRRSRWNDVQKSRLIESFLLNIPIPPIFLFERDLHEYEVVDGRQRLEAIRTFFNNEFKLKDMEFFKSLNGRKFESLEPETRRMLIRRTISATILLAESQGFDQRDIQMILFDRLNTGGVKLNHQELRNAVYEGPFNDLVLELSQTGEFRKAWDIPNPVGTDDKVQKKLEKNNLYKKMFDCELVLRVFAIKEVIESEISGSMRKLLDFTAKKYQNLSNKDSQEFHKSFMTALKKLLEIFNGSIFINDELEKPRKARNLYDSLMVAMMSIEESELQSSKIIIDNLKIVMSNEDEYEKIITKGNSIENIKYRVERAKKVLTRHL